MAIVITQNIMIKKAQPIVTWKDIKTERKAAGKETRKTGPQSNYEMAILRAYLSTVTLNTKGFISS